MKLYKLTDKQYTTHQGSTKWGKGVTNTVKKKVNEPRLCTDEVIHAYRNPNLALLLNPIHANIKKPVLWEAEGKVVVEDWGKTGSYELTTVKRLPLPHWYTKKLLRKRVQIQFANLCADAAARAARAADAAARAAAYAADAAARAAARAADAAARAVAAACAARAARAAARAARAAVDFDNLADRAVKAITGEAL